MTSRRPRPISSVGALLLVVVALLACRAKNPPPDPDSELVPAPRASGSVVPKRQVIDGFVGLRFGQRLEAVQQSAALKKRCKTVVQRGKLNKTFPAQSFVEEYLFCYATIAGRHANLHAYFDRQAALYRVCFSFDDRQASKVKRLTASQAEQFVAELRRILEPRYGTPADRSEDRPTGKELDLTWESQADSPPHKTVIRVRIGAEAAAPQQVDWIDRTREAAMRARIDKERGEARKLKGL